MSDEPAMPNAKPPVFKAELTLGNLLLLAGLLGSVIVGVWQGGQIRASLEVGLSAEHNLREVEMTSMHADIASLGRDIRDLRTIVIADKINTAAKGSVR